MADINFGDIHIENLYVNIEACCEEDEEETSSNDCDNDDKPK